MKISTKGRYALTFMLDILSNGEGSPISLKDVSKRQNVSEKYLEQIAGRLTKSGLIRSVRGANGGYLLKRKPEEYTVGEILRIMEGDLAPAPCVEANGSPCEKRNLCSSVILWEKINDAVNSVIDNTTLADMNSWRQEKY